MRGYEVSLRYHKIGGLDSKDMLKPLILEIIIDIP